MIMSRSAFILIALLPGIVSAQTKQFPLESPAGVRLHNVVAEPATLQGKKGLRVILAPGAPADAAVEQLAVIDGVDFANGVIEVELAGAPGAGAAQGARGFVGIAFRLQPDLK